MPDTRSQGPEDPLDADPAERCLGEVLALPEGEREAALERACAERPELAEELRELWSALCGLGLAGAASARTADGFPESLGDFALVEQLGAGGMGVVYRARQRSLGREVALKLLRPEALYFERSRERFRRESAAIAGLRHPAIVPVHAAGEAQGIPFFAMELIEGATLAEVLARLRGRAPRSLSGADLARALGPPEAVPRPELFELGWGDACAELVRQVAEALDHAHARGILHRDVKPSNVALTRDGRARLFDFGLAVSLEGERLTRSGGTLGTLHYMSPEQVRGEERLDARTDVYSLGVTLYELLALEAPFQGATRTALESRIFAGAPTPLRELNPRVSRELAVVCAKAMAVEPERRYASARELADDLTAVLHRRPIRALPPTLGYRARRWLRRNPALASAGLAAFGMFGVAPGVLLWRERANSQALSEAYGKESRALAAEHAALAEARDALAFLEDLLHETEPHNSGEPNTRVRDLLARGVELLQQRSPEPRVEGRLAVGIASAMASHGMYAEALPLAERAFELEQRHGFELTARANRPVEIIAGCLDPMGRYAEGIALLEPAIESQSDPDIAARMTFILGRLLAGSGRSEEAFAVFQRVEQHYRDSARQDWEARVAVAKALSWMHRRLGRPEEALEAAEEALAIAQRIYPARHPVLAETHSFLAFALLQLELCDEAVQEQSTAVTLTESALGRGSRADLAQRAELQSMLNLCGRDQEAAQLARELAELRAAGARPGADEQR